MSPYFSQTRVKQHQSSSVGFWLHAITVGESSQFEFLLWVTEIPVLIILQTVFSKVSLKIMDYYRTLIVKRRRLVFSVIRKAIWSWIYALAENRKWDYSSKSKLYAVVSLVYWKTRNKGKYLLQGLLHDPSEPKPVTVKTENCGKSLNIS